jgi:hypothetical protein
MGLTNMLPLAHIARQLDAEFAAASLGGMGGAVTPPQPIPVPVSVVHADPTGSPQLKVGNAPTVLAVR